MGIDISKIIRDAITSEVNKLHTAFPAKVIAVDGFDVDVKPLVNPQEGKSYREMPVIYSVPFLPPSVGNNRGVYFKPKVGDEVLIICAESGIDNWIESGEQSNASTGRKYSINDAVAICGFSSVPNRPEIADDEVVIQNGESLVTLKESGDVVLNKGSDFGVSFTELSTAFTTLSTQVISLGTALGITIPPVNINSAKVSKVRL